MAVIQIAVFAIAAGIIFTAVYLDHGQRNLVNTQDKNSAQEIALLVTKIGKFFMLPSRETPTLATVIDKNKLQAQALFPNVEDGDKVLAYTIAKKVILYRPSENKIIAVGTIYEK